MHLYLPDGTPVYELPYAGKRQGTRPATLRDAKKLGLYPSVTEILKIIDKPGLNRWKEEQMMMACLTTPRIENEPEAAYLKRVKKSAEEASTIARDTGQAIHDAVEKRFNGLKPQDHAEVSQKIYDAICERYGHRGWVAEHSFGAYGYGGRIDLMNRKPEKHRLEIVADLKTKEQLDTTKDGSYYGYDEHVAQLAAYAVGVGLKDALLVNVFSDWNGNVLFCEWLPDDVERGLNLFNAAFELWKIIKKYDPVYGTDPTRNW